MQPYQNHNIEKKWNFDINSNIGLKWYHWSKHYLILMTFIGKKCKLILFKHQKVNITLRNEYTGIGFQIKISQHLPALIKWQYLLNYWKLPWNLLSFRDLIGCSLLSHKYCMLIQVNSG